MQDYTNIKPLSRIYIIESSSLDDLENDRKEGYALSEMLRLANIKNHYFYVSDKQAFAKVFKEIIETEKGNNEGVITLHFSMHGNENGIELTNKEFILWKTLYTEYLKTFIDAVGHGSLKSGHIFAPFHLHFSVCKGFYARKIKDIANVPPYYTLIGPIKEVDWTESLVAFITLYHNTIHTQIGVRLSVEKMNIAANLDNIFQVDFPNDDFSFSR
jgi:hypothetical protein